jgi:serine/threonine-protein kinase HipA
MALKVVRSKRWADFDKEELTQMAAKAGLPERLVLTTATDTVARFLEAWEREQPHLPMHNDVREAVALQLERIPLARS